PSPPSMTTASSRFHCHLSSSIHHISALSSSPLPSHHLVIWNLSKTSKTLVNSVKYHTPLYHHSLDVHTYSPFSLLYPVRLNTTSFCSRPHLIVWPFHTQEPLVFHSIK
ncbi:hypothetical protein BDR07DRAFT_1402704, partial [Suillus spraguei]